MTQSAAQADAFFREATAARDVWAVRDDAGFPAPMAPDGKRAMPFWSKKSRAQTVVDSVAAYSGFTLVSIPLEDWLERWLPDLEKKGCNIGVNWSGPGATGYDLPPGEVLRRLKPSDSRGH